MATQKEKKQNQLVVIKEHFNKPAVLDEFVNLFGNDLAAKSHIANALLVVSGNETLSKCTPKSIFRSALQIASLKLNIDPQLGQAYLLPFYNNKEGRFECQHIIGYHGYRDLALRTGNYEDLNAGPVYEGMIVEEDYIRGRVTISGEKTSDVVKGWFGYLRLKNGYEKVIYWTIEQIHAHAKEYSKNYEKKYSLWQNPVERPKMERKTVFLQLLRHHGVFSPADAELLKALKVESEEAYEVDYSEIHYDQSEESGEAIQAPKPITARPLSPEALKIYLNNLANEFFRGKTSITSKQIGRIIGAFQSCYADKEDRYIATEFLFGKKSMNDVTPAQAFALEDWLDMNDDNKPDQIAGEEARLIITASKEDKPGEEPSEDVEPEMYRDYDISGVVDKQSYRTFAYQTLKIARNDSERVNQCFEISDDNPKAAAKKLLDDIPTKAEMK